MLQPGVAEGVHRVEDAYTNWYILEDGPALTIVDCGVPTSWQSLGEALAKLGRRTDQVEAIVLTHAHFDHIGFAERARRQLGVPVWVHENDVPLTRHPLQYAHERRRAWYFATQLKALPIVASLLPARAFFPQPVESVRRYEDGTLPVPGAPQVVFTPGHTLGHCALHLPERETLIAGDALVTLDPIAARPARRSCPGPPPPTASATSGRSTRSWLPGRPRCCAGTESLGAPAPESAVAKARAAGSS